MPDDWVNLVRQTSKKFNVIRMTPADFKSFSKMDSFVTKTVNGMREVSWIHMKKDTLDIVYYKKTP